MAKFEWQERDGDFLVKCGELHGCARQGGGGIWVGEVGDAARCVGNGYDLADVKAHVEEALDAWIAKAKKS